MPSYQTERILSYILEREKVLPHLEYFFFIILFGENEQIVPVFAFETQSCQEHAYITSRCMGIIHIEEKSCNRSNILSIENQNLEKLVCILPLSYITCIFSFCIRTKMRREIEENEKGASWTRR